MAQNITLLGANYQDVPAVQLPKTGGGLAQFDDTTDANATAADILTGKTAYVNGSKIIGTNPGGGGGSWDWMGEDATHVSTLTLEKTLAETDFNTWTPSTTAKVILTAQTLTSSFAVDMTNYEYVVLADFDTKIVYTSTPSGVHHLRFFAHWISYMDRKPPTGSTVESSFTRKLNGSGVLTYLYYLNYQNANGYKYLINQQYGAAYCSANPTLTYASTSAASTTVTVSSPAISARANNSYAPAASLSLIDKTASKFKYVVNIYRLKKDTTDYGVRDVGIMNLWQNPLF